MGIEKQSTSTPTLDVWIIILGESVTRENFELCSRAVDKTCIPKTSYLKGETAWRYIIGCLLPQFTMRQCHIGRPNWSFSKTKVVEGPGKAYLALKHGSKKPGDSRKALGFDWAETGAAMAYAHSMGNRESVINLGVGIHMLKPLVSARSHIMSHLHQLTDAEEYSISLERHSEEKALRRLHIILGLKQSYLKAIGQPVGFDLSRIECDVRHQKITVDGQALSGWEFTVFTANVDAHKKIQLSEHQLQYIVVVAVFRGAQEKLQFFFPDQDDMGFVKFLDVSHIIRDVPRLGDYDSAPMPPLDQIPLSAKSSIQSFDTVKQKYILDSRQLSHSRSSSSSRRNTPEKLKSGLAYPDNMHAQYSRPFIVPGEQGDMVIPVYTKAPR